MHLSNAATRVRAAEQRPTVFAAAANGDAPADRLAYRAGDRNADEYLRVVRGVELGPNLRSLVAKARQEVLVLRADRHVSPAWGNADLLSAARGVTVRILHPRSVSDTDCAAVPVTHHLDPAAGVKRTADTSNDDTAYASSMSVSARQSSAARLSADHSPTRTDATAGAARPPLPTSSIPTALFARLDGPAQRLLGPGVQVRELPKPSTAFLVVDRELAALAIEPVDTTGPQLVTRAPGIVAALVSAFERHWSTALPTGPGGGLPDGAAADILTCMADGMTDESIARRLGVCTRTVGRAVGRMMESLGARNRFELGVRALQAGWFD